MLATSLQPKEVRWDGWNDHGSVLSSELTMQNEMTKAQQHAFGYILTASMRVIVCSYVSA